MKLDDLFAEFEGLDAEERLELLIDFAETLPPLDAPRVAIRDSGQCRVEECQTPVFLWVGVEGGRMKLAAEVPAKSPTVRGYVAMLVQGLSDELVEDVLALPDNIVARLGLQETLGMTRFRGFQGILARIKRQALQSAS